MATEKLLRRKWTVPETKAFLTAYACRQDEFAHARNRQHAMANVLADLEALGVLTQPTTTNELKSKIKNLLRAFKTAKDAQNTAGVSRTKLSSEEDNAATHSFGRTPRSNSQFLEAKLNLKRQVMENEIQIQREKMAKLDEVMNLLKK